MDYILSAAVSLFSFVALTFLISAKPKLSKKISCFTLLFCVICGIGIYGYGYFAVTDNRVLAVLNTILAVMGSFLGKNDFGSISAAPLMQMQWAKILCTLVQISALYTTFNAVISTLGANALKLLSLRFKQKEDMNIIYGTGVNALAFGKELIENKKGVVVFVDSNPDSATLNSVSDLGCILKCDANAVNGNRKFLNDIYYKKSSRKLTLFALSKNSGQNLNFAENLLNSLKQLKIPVENTTLVLKSREESTVSRLQNSKDKYGYGFVSVVNEPNMAARLLTTKFLPCKTLNFDSNGNALNDFEALIIGFGQVGQAVLKSIIMNGQFEGSHFKADIFAKNIHNTNGNFEIRFGNLSKQYDISFHEEDVLGLGFYNYLTEHLNTLRYIVISAGDDNTNHEIAEEILSYLNEKGIKIETYTCSREKVSAYNSDSTIRTSHRIFTTDLLCTNILDQKAMVLNHRYQNKTDKTALENWMCCDYFSRQSCRAATDFIPSLLYAVGKSEESVIEDGFSLTEKQIDILSRTEHLRWCAFHFCSGFSTMTQNEFSERADLFTREKEEKGVSNIRISKNMQNKTHACLVPWEELDALSSKESEFLEKKINYKKMDTDNVLSIPLLLKESIKTKNKKA